MEDRQRSFTLMEEYLDYMLTIQGRSALTVKEYHYDLTLFFRYYLCFRKKTADPKKLDEADISGINEKILSEINLQDLYAFLSWMARERNAGNSNRARKVSALRSFFKYLSAKRGVIPTDPAAELESPRRVKRQPRYLSLDESKQLLAQPLKEEGPLAVRNHTILTLFLNCGLRLAELCSINLSDIREDTMTVMGKGGKERTIYLNSACVRAIEAYRQVRPKDNVKEPDALFISRQGNRISQSAVQRMIHQYILRAGLDPKRYSTHKLRHTAATLMYQYGEVDIRLLQHILGHSSVATTEIYTHLDNAQLHSAVDKNPLANEQPRKSSDNEN